MLIDRARRDVAAETTAKALAPDGRAALRKACIALDECIADVLAGAHLPSIGKGSEEAGAPASSSGGAGFRGRSQRAMRSRNNRPHPGPAEA